MQGKTSTTSLEGSPSVSPAFVGTGTKHLAIKKLHTFQIFYIKYRAAQLHIQR